jgi:hypothetical protein
MTTEISVYDLIPGNKYAVYRTFYDEKKSATETVIMYGTFVRHNFDILQYDLDLTSVKTNYFKKYYSNADINKSEREYWINKLGLTLKEQQILACMNENYEQHKQYLIENFNKIHSFTDSEWTLKKICDYYQFDVKDPDVFMSINPYLLFNDVEIINKNEFIQNIKEKKINFDVTCLENNTDNIHFKYSQDNMWWIYITNLLHSNKETKIYAV